ncbi:DUF3549 family protein [Vibrio sp. PP-XX7]
MTPINTLTDLLKQSGCTYQVIELGRRIHPIAATEFEKIESRTTPLSLSNPAYSQIRHRLLERTQPTLDMVSAIRAR